MTFLSRWSFPARSFCSKELHLVGYFYPILTKIRMCLQILVKPRMPNFVDIHLAVFELLHA